MLPFIPIRVRSPPEPRVPETLDWSSLRARLAHTAEKVAQTLNPQPEQALAILAARARALARHPPAPLAASAVLEVVTFWLDGEQYGLETQYVWEVIRLEALTPVPGSPARLAGVTNLRGEVLPVADWRGLSSPAAQSLPLDGRVLVLGQTQPELGWLSEQVDEILRLRKEDLLDVPAGVSETRRPFLRGVTAQALSVLDGAALLRNEMFYF